MSGGCSISDCEKPGKLKRGMCVMHYERWRRNGDPMKVRKIIGDELARFLSMVEKTEGCWLWAGPVNRHGYSAFKARGHHYGHRWSYAHHKGPIPDGLVIDHLCRVPRCVNPDHLEAVTQYENFHRGHGSHSGSGRCRKGHDVTLPGALTSGAESRCVACREAAA